MAQRWYGSVHNRIEENRMYCDEIRVGTGMTEYSYSDRDAYEVIEVIDQKHVIVRRYDHKHVGDTWCDNDWELISNENNPAMLITKRGNYWYWTNTVTAEQFDAMEKINQLYCCMNGFDPDVIRSKGKQTKYRRANVSFGVAEYYYDYEF